MDNLVSVPVTHPSTFLKQQAKATECTTTIPDARARQVQRDPLAIETIKSPDADPPVKPKRAAKPSVARKLAQQWLAF